MVTRVNCRVMVDTDFRDRLKRAREEAGIGPTELARVLSVDRSMIYNYEKGRNEMSLSILERFAAATGKPVEWFLGTGDEPLNTKAALSVVVRAVEDNERLRSRVSELESEVQDLRAQLAIVASPSARTDFPQSREDVADGPSRSRDTQPESSAPKPARHGQGKISRQGFRRSPGPSSRSDDSEQATS